MRNNSKEEAIQELFFSTRSKKYQWIRSKESISEQKTPDNKQKAKSIVREK